MRTITLALALAAVSLSPLAQACKDHAPGTEPGKHAAGPRSAKVAGEVREVDVEEGTVTLAHARIASLRMGPMSSMPFKALDTKLIANLKPGDKVTFRARLIDQQPTVTEIRVARR